MRAPKVAVLVLLAACSSGGGASSPSPAQDSDAGAKEAGPAAPSLDATAPVSDGAAASEDAGSYGDATSGADADAGASCAWGGAPGVCISVSDCAALTDHSSYAGECPGPATIECCLPTPSTADNPPVPTGYQLMAQADVTTDMTTWAVAILNDPVTYPMFATTTKTFGTLTVLARVEWHPPDFQNAVVHRGVTLYEPI